MAGRCGLPCSKAASSAASGLLVVPFHDFRHLASVIIGVELAVEGIILDGACVDVWMQAKACVSETGVRNDTRNDVRDDARNEV